MILNQIQERKIEKILDGKVIAQEIFTAYDITKALRKSENVYHFAVRDFIHATMHDLIDLNEYKRSMHHELDVSGSPIWSAFRYEPVSIDDITEDDIDDITEDDIDDPSLEDEDLLSKKEDISSEETDDDIDNLKPRYYPYLTINQQGNTVVLPREDGSSEETEINIEDALGISDLIPDSSDDMLTKRQLVYQKGIDKLRMISKNDGTQISFDKDTYIPIPDKNIKDDVGCKSKQQQLQFPKPKNVGVIDNYKLWVMHPMRPKFFARSKNRIYIPQKFLYNYTADEHFYISYDLTKNLVFLTNFPMVDSKPINVDKNNKSLRFTLNKKYFINRRGIQFIASLSVLENITLKFIIL